MAAQNAGHWSLLVSNMLNISQGSVATRLRYGGIFHQQLHYKFTADCKSKRVLKIGHHVAKLTRFTWKTAVQQISACHSCVPCVIHNVYILPQKFPCRDLSIHIS